MNTFCFLLRKKIDFKDNIYWRDTIKLTYLFFIRDYEIQNLHIQNKKNHINVKHKYVFLNKVMTNIFLNETQKENIMAIFSQIQKIYFAFARIAYIYKFKKSKILVNHDLTLSPLHISNKYCFCLLQNNNRYLFHVNDLINIANTSLSNSPSFFADPLVLKNPYNNVPFNKSTLYNIYFFIRKSTIVLPELLHLFFLTNFNISLFADHYEHVIREYALKYFVKNSAVATLHMHILDMLDEYNSEYSITFPYWRINIDIDFPQNKLVDIMRPYLLLYMRSHYSLVHTVRVFSKNRLKQKLDSLYTYNPSFGRKKIDLENKYVFDDKYPKFIKSSRNFLNTHHEKIITQTRHVFFNMNNINSIHVFNDEYDEIDDDEYISAFQNIQIII